MNTKPRRALITAAPAGQHNKPQQRRQGEGNARGRTAFHRKSPLDGGAERRLARGVLALRASRGAQVNALPDMLCVLSWLA
jgi:hypothetical protein